MTVLELSFPAGRYHATPWGRHVNEGAVEWPPSPWRIVRALIATWHLKAREIPEETVRSLVNALSQPPAFRLPRARASHTRHYMPLGNEKTTKVFDTFIQLEEGSAILVAWDATLDDDERAAFMKLAERLGYFGRAESLVEARVLEGITGIEANAVPLDCDASPPPMSELVRLLAPVAPAAYTAWREDFSAKGLAAFGPKPTAAQIKKLPALPDDIFAALHANTGDLQAAGWNLPPGAEFVNYTRREDAFAPATRPLSRRKGPLPTAARYAVVSTVPPSLTQAVSIGDRVHDALCKWSDQGGGRAAVFTGIDENGKPRNDHQHAHVLCEANGARDTVTHLTVWAPAGFDADACFALRRLNRVWGHGGHDLRLVLHGIGQPSDFADCTLFGPGITWRSITPFVPTRHAKTFRDGRPKIDPENGWQEGCAAHDLLRLLALRPSGVGAHIQLLAERDLPLLCGAGNHHRLRSLQFQVMRHNGAGSRGPGGGASFNITFPTPQAGPIALGYGAHFGLGLFVPVTAVPPNRSMGTLDHP